MPFATTPTIAGKKREYLCVRGREGERERQGEREREKEREGEREEKAHDYVEDY